MSIVGTDKKDRVAKIVGFPQRHLCERGTTVALYDYALANEDLCGNVSVIFYDPIHPYNVPAVVKKFKDRFTVIEYYSFTDIERYIKDCSLDYLYVIKYGYPDENITTKIPCLIHSVFTWGPHGPPDKYACVSRQIAEKNKGIWLPHIVTPLPTSPSGRTEFRSEHKIPEDAYVYGRYGGKETFSIEYVKEAIKEGIDTHPKVWFVFVNTNRFITHPRVIFIDTIADLTKKGDFVSACDAMIHARLEGETFGLAVAEFISGGKPVLSCLAPLGNDNEHIHLGKEWITLYKDKADLKDKLWNVPILVPSTPNPYDNFSAEKVMKIFGTILGDPESFAPIP
jgi:glycosyltransferase involved in cell wall biosynthesis